MLVREAALAYTPRWDSRVSKLLIQAAVSVEHPVSESERALAGEAGVVVDRAKPFFESTARPERERETRTEAPDAGTRVVEDPAPQSRDASSAFRAFVCTTTSPATLLRYFDALYGQEDPGSRDFSAAVTSEDENVTLTARSSDLVLVLSALASSGSDEIASETAFRRLGELAREREPSPQRHAPSEITNASPEATRVDEAREQWLGPTGPTPTLREFLSVSEARLDETACEAAVAALCRFAPRDARQFLREANVGYRLRRALRHCEYYGVFEAQALVLERMGRASEAVSVCVAAYAARLKRATRDAGDAGVAAFKAEGDDVVAVAVGACFRESAASTSAPCLWTKLLSGLARHLRSSAERSGAVRAVVESHVRAVLRAAQTVCLRASTRLDGFAGAALRERFEDEDALGGFRVSLFLSGILASDRARVLTAETARRRAEARRRAAAAARASAGKQIKIVSRGGGGRGRRVAAGDFETLAPRFS